MSTDYALLCPGTRRRLDLQGVGASVLHEDDGTVTAEALARADGGRWGLRVDAALWVQAQGRHPVYLVCEDEDAYQDPCEGWALETLYGPDRWQKRLNGHGVMAPTSWGVKGATTPKGMTRLTINR